MILGICPFRDQLTTKYSYLWFRKILDHARYNVTKIEGPDLDRKKLLNSVQQSKPTAVIFYDHGSKRAFFNGQIKGKGTKKILKMTDAYLFRNIKIYTLACETAKKLLPKMIRKGAKVVWGYEDYFGMCGGKYETLFENQANCGLQALLDGKTFAQAKDIFIDICNKMIKDLDDKSEGIVADQLRANLEGLKVLGNTDIDIY